MCRIKWKPKKAAAGEWACVCGVGVCGHVCGSAGEWACGFLL